MKIAETIKRILKDYPETRSSDKELQIILMQESGMMLTPIQIEKFKDMPSFESIRRTRQKIQEDGLYVATDRVRRARRFKSYEVQQRITQTPIEKVPNLLSIFGDDRNIS